MNCDQHLDYHLACAQCSADRIGELEWLAAQGEVWSALTVRRAGFRSVCAAERALCRASRGDIVARLRMNVHRLGVNAYA